MTRIKLTLLFLLTVMTMSAQKQFTLEDLNYGGDNYYNMSPRSKYYEWWGDQLMYLDAEKGGKVLANGKEELALFTLSQVNEALAKPKAIVNAYSATYPYAKKPLVLLSSGKMKVLYNFDTKKVEWSRECSNEGSADWNKTSKATAFVRDYQLYVVDANGKSTQLTTDGSREIVYGQSVHRDEFGISKGTFWNADGSRLAFYRMDQSMVTDYPQVDIFQREAAYAPDKYPMAGETSHKVTVGVYDLKSGKTIYLKAGDPTDRYFTNIQWSPDGNTIYMFELNRDQNDCRLVSYNAQTGTKEKELYREQSDKYVEPMHPIEFLPWDNNKFIMQSQKDGYNHLYLFDVNGKQLKQLTSGKWVVLELVGFNKTNKSVIITSNEKSPIQNNIYSVSVGSGKRTLLDNGRGVHYASLSDGGLYVCDNYSEPTVPRNIELLNTTKPNRSTLFSADDPWKGYNVPEYTSGIIKAADGTTDLYYRMVKPVNFDANKKYPTIIYVYGGPHAHCVDARWHFMSRGWETYMAQKGYLIFVLDNRGSEYRGRDFEQATFRQLGQVEMKDQMKGVEYLKSLPYVDANRMGVHGWSFGGFMTISLMTNYPDVFKVGVAGGPVIDWKWYEVMYGERYMDTPQTNPDGYAKTSLLAKAKDLKGKLQIITGYNDQTVVPQHCISFLSACIQAGTQPDFFIYPGEPHNMRGHQSVHLHQRISQYFDDYLK